jgi:transcriptional regulator
MYIPTAFAVPDEARLLDFIDRYSFATLVTVHEQTPLATHLPLLLDRERRLLLGHVARANPQWTSLESCGSALAIFTGPHGYVSPNWYEKTPAVPTWNYTAVHVYGRATLISDAPSLQQFLERLIQKYEAHLPRPWSGELPEEYRSAMIQGIVGFEIAIDRLEGKFKLSQNRSAADQQGVVEHLRQLPGADRQELADFMEAWLGARPEATPAGSSGR